jgi:hypothetical protein
MRLYYAGFLGVLGDDTKLQRQEREAITRAEAADLNPSELRYLAGAHAHMGNTRHAMEILRYALRHGRRFGRPG